MCVWPALIRRVEARSASGSWSAENTAGVSAGRCVNPRDWLCVVRRAESSCAEMLNESSRLYSLYSPKYQSTPSIFNGQFTDHLEDLKYSRTPPKGPFTPCKSEKENFLLCLNFFLWSLLLVLWSFSLSRSLSLGVIRPQHDSFHLLLQPKYLRKEGQAFAKKVLLYFK